MTDINLGELEVYFRVLGLEPGTSQKDVKEAYRNHLQAFHPDKYPKDSSSQKWATEKLVQVNEANEKLSAFFEKYPDGQPPGGWTKSAGATSFEQAEPETNSSDSTNWTAWEKKQSTTFESELKDFEEREQKRQEESKKGKAYEDRKKIVFVGKIVLVVVIAAMWIGRSTNSSHKSYTRQLEANAWRERAIYDHQTGGTSFSPFGMSQGQIRQRSTEQARSMMLRAKYWGRV
jgi:curved DNA-binding protein CbpA